MAGAATGERSLKETPTWAVAFVCALFVILSILIEHGIQSLGKWFQKRQKKAMIEALEKIKAELMLLGFISLLLTVGSTLIYKICIPARYGQYMLPCQYKSYDQDDGDGDKGGGGGGGDNERKLLFYAGDMTRRVLAAGAGGGDYCSTKMGSHMKKTIFEEQTAKAIKKWQKAAKERRKLRKEGGGGDHSTVNGSSPSPSQGGASPLFLLHNHQHRSNQPASDIESVPASPTAAYLYNYPSDTEISEIELGDQPRNNHEDDNNNNNNNNRTFSFGKR
ncbi:hypothetical protein LWI29_015182 [Acer saccharum]|uniref:MLO-like protein n=1 Tax=Acer saccharum TaxID=4024 RepID=A0AA39RMW9_ACESA|nr:hypothetical protein LWI29_015182 [Acer saccharum]